MSREELAGAPGFEPGNGGTKNRCLTTWRRPNIERGVYIIGARAALATRVFNWRRFYGEG